MKGKGGESERKKTTQLGIASLNNAFKRMYISAFVTTL